MSSTRHRNLRRICSTSLLVLLILLTSSCSIRFKHDWRKAASANPSPTDLSGAWLGTWRSEGSGHHGTLRAIVTTVPERDNTWQFRYHATWAKILSGGYTTYHIAIPQRSGSYKISGQHDLGKLFGGTFHYEGTATPTHFKATYRSSNDHGIFEMSRPIKNSAGQSQEK